MQYILSYLIFKSKCFAKRLSIYFKVYISVAIQLSYGFCLHASTLKNKTAIYLNCNLDK